MGFEPTTTRTTIWRSTPELYPPRKIDIMLKNGKNVKVFFYKIIDKVRFLSLEDLKKIVYNFIYKSKGDFYVKFKSY